MNPADPLEITEAARTAEPYDSTSSLKKQTITREVVPDDDDEFKHASYSNQPTEQELATLPRVSGKIPWPAMSIAFVELCERFSYYGTTAVFVNFIQQPLPKGSVTGAGKAGQSGALGMGQRASTGLTTFNSFWAYLMPLFGAYVADQYLGRYKTIMWAILIAIIGHGVLLLSALPTVIIHPHTALVFFAIGIVIMGCGVGGFKSNISPLIAEQYNETKMRIVVNKKGQRVVMDPAVTISRIFMYFYMMINIGSLVGQIGMVYAEKYVGFWLAFAMPTFMFFICPLVLFACRKIYVLTPPQGSVLATAAKLLKLGMRGRWSINPIKTIRNVNAPGFWDDVKPSNVTNPPVWMTFDDAWVDQVRRGLKACKLFLWFPVYWLAYNQMTNNLTSQAASMELHGVPNDIINNLNPISLIVFIPIMDNVIYPAIRKTGFRFTPIKRITVGFFFGSAAMVAACITQIYIYRLSPCGKKASTCDDPAPINVWVQSVAYIFIGLSEIFASITGLEYAFTKAPRNMRSLVMALFLFMSAISSAIGQGLTTLSEDPLLVWNYGATAVLALLGGIGFWFTHRSLDAEEDSLNQIADSDFTANASSNAHPYDEEK